MDRRLYELLGQTIADKRDNKAFTQQQLADKVSLTRTSITNIERGRQHIQLHTLYLLAKALSVEVVDMLPSRKSVENAGGEKSITLSTKYYSPSGRAIQDVAVTPNVLVADAPEDDGGLPDDDEAAPDKSAVQKDEKPKNVPDDQLNKALEVLKNRQSKG